METEAERIARERILSSGLKISIPLNKINISSKTMAPRSLGEIFSEITSTDDGDAILDLFLKYLDEIFSHPKEQIN